MKNKVVTIPINGHAELTDPFEKGRNKFYVNVNVKDIPLEMSLEYNPRNADTESRVSKNISESLLSESNNFNLLNRGLTVIADEAKIDGRRHCLELKNPILIDGGHTWAVIKKFIIPTLQMEKKPGFTDAFVEMKVLTNINSDLAIELAESLNTSAQVKDVSLENLKGSFDWLKDAIKDTPFHDKVSYKENELGEIDVRKIISILTLFHPNFVADEPVIAYSSVQKCLSMWKDPEAQEGYQKLRPILVDILEFFDYVQLKFEDNYKKAGGFNAVNPHYTPKSSAVKMGKIVEIKSVDEGFTLPFLRDTCYYKYPMGWIYPLVGSFKPLISFKGSGAKWRMSPFDFYNEHGKNSISALLSTIKDLGRNNPNYAGKNRLLYSKLTEVVMNQYTKLIGVDLDQVVKV